MTARAWRSLGRRQLALAVVVAAIAAAVAVVVIVSSGPTSVRRRSERDVTAWAAPGRLPLPDARAAALVTRQPEDRPENRAANDYVPTAAQLRAFHAAQKAAADYNPSTAYVTGRPGIADPSTDDLIQWAAWKWGIPTDWLRAEYVVESRWEQSTIGDLARVTPSERRLYPRQARINGKDEVYQSMGITGVKWIPYESVGAGTEPLRWKSTAFNIDYQAATLRYYYDGDCNWCSAGYHAGEAWSSIGAWYSPQPWDNGGALEYIRQVKYALAQTAWRHSGF
jgi:hypothetical protein